MLAVLLASWAGAVAAQDDAEAAAVSPERGGDLMVDLGTWIAQPAGLEYRPALEGNEIRDLAHGTEAEERWTVGYFLPNDSGLLEVTYFAHRTKSALSKFTPGQPNFTELWPDPELAGYNNDGRADGFSSEAETVVRDLRLRFSRPAFSTKTVDARWFVGWRRVAHQRLASARYYTVAPLEFPTAAVDLFPEPDLAELESRYEGRGPDAGFAVDFDLWRRRITLETELSLAVLRGNINHFYRSLNALYATDSDGDGVLDTLIDPPYTNANLSGVNVRQTFLETILTGDSLSTTSQVVEAQIGFRYKIRDWVHVKAGFRSARYDDVGADIRPVSSSVGFISGIDETGTSATYEGFYTSATFFMF